MKHSRCSRWNVFQGSEYRCHGSLGLQVHGTCSLSLAENHHDSQSFRRLGDKEQKNAEDIANRS